MKILQVLIYISSVFIGYAIGRISHMYGGYLNAPHHWIYGLILMIAGLSFYKYSHRSKILKRIGMWAFYFGVGLFVSDFKDFLQLKFFGVDEHSPKFFWGVD